MSQQLPPPPPPQWGQPPSSYPLPAPQPEPKRKKPIYKRVWFWVAVVVVLGVIGAASGGSKSAADPSSAVGAPSSSVADSSSQAAAPSSSAAATTKAAPTKQAAGIGTPVRDGKFEFTVNGVDCSKATIGDSPYLTKDAQGVFCIVSMHVANIGDKAQTFDASSQEASNAAGQKYSADSSAAMYLGDAGNSFLEQINPGNAVDGQIVYDVPAGTQLTQLELHDSMFSGGVKVSLG
jgi:hypothetical protein